MAHAKALHAELGFAQLSILNTASQTPLKAIPTSNCPFCDQWEERLRKASRKETKSSSDSVLASSGVILTVEPRQFERHVAAHLQQLALFAIPRGPGMKKKAHPSALTMLQTEAGK
ncbi:hypothetical protein F5X96DRAFT_270307 [Biscogniauxia mediterranea]|nr:hypothetical protein F5X96DRAFT_270307 [Biscogniauxia mediterranea]